MKKAIGKHLRDFVAIIFLVVLAAGIAGYILSNQRFYPPAWVPLIGTDFYELEAELSTAQAVVPGQGQTVNIAGVKVGDIGSVSLEDGRAVVEMKIQPEHAPVYKDATILLRPKTGLKDMYLELDPGTQERRRVRRGRPHHRGQHAAGREPRRDPGAARRGYPRLPARVAQRRGRGRSTATRRPSCARPSSASSPPPAPRGRSPPSWCSAGAASRG